MASSALVKSMSVGGSYQASLEDEGGDPHRDISIAANDAADNLRATTTIMFSTFDSNYIEMGPISVYAISDQVVPMVPQKDRTRLLAGYALAALILMLVGLITVYIDPSPLAGLPFLVGLFAWTSVGYVEKLVR